MDPTPSSSTGAVRARGLLSSNDLDRNDADATPEGEVFIGAGTAAANAAMRGSFNDVVLSKVTSITNADPNANGTAIPTGTQRAIAQFKFSTAAANNLKNGTNKWTLSGVIFNVNATNVQLGSGDNKLLASSTFKVYNKADPTVKHTCTAAGTSVSGNGASGSLVVLCSGFRDTTSVPGKAASLVNTEIDPGTDATIVLEAHVVNAKISNASTSTLQVSLQGINENPIETVFGSSNSHVVWLDKDNSTTTIFNWIEYPDTSVNGTSYNG
jgi:hypothetical protein